MKTIILTLSAAKDLDALPRESREQAEGGMHRYAMTGQGDLKALQGREGFRLRIGGYRVIFDQDATTIQAGCDHNSGDLHWPPNETTYRRC